ncbi:hypothetical protein L2E82_43979 [Cichorium intybus]|uniref:Uncharacterized protein n=1 Tax=Cichorium intybus TaxID=13427 RepID=A0ACB8ZPD4_CICIN|nr:hypothetical protein L2E82_43979 [Cichorium intybus]
MEWVRGKTIGHGSFATISLAQSITHNSNLPPLMAVKSCGVSHSASLIHEKLILAELNACPEIIHCFGDSFTVENGVKIYNVALEYASGGDLASNLKNSGNFSSSEVRRYTNSILKGLQFIHRNGFVHCDIKLQNILLVSDDSNADVKIADFGLAKKAAGELKSKYEIRGTPMYMAPETVVKGEQEPPSDIWALGCLVVEMITGNLAWPCSDIAALLLKIGVGTEIPEIPAKLSSEGKDFLGKCFLKDPTKRWTAEMLLDHPFVSKEKVEDQTPSISPRDPFDFLDWESAESFVMTELPSPGLSHVSPSISPATRLRRLTGDERPNWNYSSRWVAIR